MRSITVKRKEKETGKDSAVARRRQKQQTQELAKQKRERKWKMEAREGTEEKKSR